MTSFVLRSLVPSPLAVDIRLDAGESKTIGRSKTADICIDDPSLSRLHARITARGLRLQVDDLGSMNGILLNGTRSETGTLGAGERVQFGSLEYVLDGAPRVAPPPPDQTIVRMKLAVATGHTPPGAEALEALLATSRELMAFGDLPGLLDRVLDRLHSILRPNRSAILLLDRDTGELAPRAVRPVGAYRSVSEFASSTVVREALVAGEVLVVADAMSDLRLQTAQSVIRAGVRSVICVPLFGRTGPIGALYADRLSAAVGFSPELVSYATAFAAHAAAALETAQLYDDRERLFRTTLEAFAKAIDARDHYTAGHSERVTAYTLALARHVGVPAPELETIRRAAMLHDMGKVGVPDVILLKPGPLDQSERAIMESHVIIGYGMAEPLTFLQQSLPAIRGHHERWDGRGYPDRLAGDGIHFHARLMAVADAYDAMTSARPYRTSLGVLEAARRLRADSGRQFDAAVIDTFENVEEEFVEIHTAWSNI
jgi:putative nucleotidyltransferase with HDIG domain